MGLVGVGATVGLVGSGAFVGATVGALVGSGALVGATVGAVVGAAALGASVGFGAAVGGTGVAAGAQATRNARITMMLNKLNESLLNIDFSSSGNCVISYEEKQRSKRCWDFPPFWGINLVNQKTTKQRIPWWTTWGTLSSTWRQA
jgi:hypothetical protein